MRSEEKAMGSFGLHRKKKILMLFVFEEGHQKAKRIDYSKK